MNVVNQINKYQLDIYPNPASREFSVLVNGTGEEKAELVILDMMSKVMHRQTILTGSPEKMNVDALKLEKGIYILQILGKNAGLQKKIIVNP